MATPLPRVDVALQLVSADPSVAIRVYLDKKLVYDGATVTKPLAGPSVVPPIELGKFSLGAMVRHTLVAETTGTGIKSQTEWTPQVGGPAWLVVSYFAGRPEAAEPAFFGVALQNHAYLVK
jgi:hypothetical protein